MNRILKLGDKGKPWTRCSRSWRATCPFISAAAIDTLSRVGGRCLASFFLPAPFVPTPVRKIRLGAVPCMGPWRRTVLTSPALRGKFPQDTDIGESAAPAKSQWVGEDPELRWGLPGRGAEKSRPLAPCGHQGESSMAYLALERSDLRGPPSHPVATSWAARAIARGVFDDANN